MAWAAQHFEKHKEAWRKPPDGSIKSDVPFACRFLYQQAATDLLSGIVGAPNDARRWYVYLRLFPELVLRDTQRSGRSASNEISRRLHLWRQFQWEQLYKECRAPSKSKPNGPDPGLENDGDGALRRAAQKTRDGEYSRGAAALDLARRADTSIANFAVLLGMHPRAPLERVVQQLRGGRHIVLDADILAACAHGMPKSVALYLQPRHLRCIALSAHGSLMLAKVCTRVINGQVPGIIEPSVRPQGGCF